MSLKRVVLSTIVVLGIAVVSWLAIVHAGPAPQGAPLAVYGYITDNGQPKPNRAVRLHGPWHDGCHWDGSGPVSTTYTNQSGLYEFKDFVPPQETHWYIVEDGCQDYCVSKSGNGYPVRQDFHLERGCW